MRVESFLTQRRGDAEIFYGVAAWPPLGRDERLLVRGQVTLVPPGAPRPAPRVGLGLDGGADEIEGGRLNAP